MSIPHGGQESEEDNRMGSKARYTLEGHSLPTRLHLVPQFYHLQIVYKNPESLIGLNHSLG